MMETINREDKQDQLITELLIRISVLEKLLVLHGVLKEEEISNGFTESTNKLIEIANKIASKQGNN